MFFFFNDTATTEIYTLSLHDALPICEGVEIDLAYRARVGSQLRAYVLRKTYLGQPFQDLCAAEETVGLVVEDQRHNGKTEERDRPQVREVGHAVQLHFHGHRDLLLHLLGRVAWPLADNLHPRVRDIWIGLHRKVMKRDQAPEQQHDAEAEDQDFFSKGEINEGSDHVGLC